MIKLVLASIVCLSFINAQEVDYNLAYDFKVLEKKDSNKKMFMVMENGQVKKKKITTLFKNGNIKSIENFAKGRIDGTSKFFDEQNILRKKENYSNGNKTGVTTMYDEQGNKVSEVTYLNDSKNGIARYYENNILSKEVIYKDNIAIKEQFKNTSDIDFITLSYLDKKYE